MSIAIACDIEDGYKKEASRETARAVSQGKVIYLDKERYNKKADQYSIADVKIIDWKGHDIVLLGQYRRGYSFHDPECKKCKVINNE